MSSWHVGSGRQPQKFGQNQFRYYSWDGAGQMTPWQFTSAKEGSQKLTLKFGCNRISNSWGKVCVEPPRLIWWRNKPPWLICWGWVCKLIFMSNPTTVEDVLYWGWVGGLTILEFRVQVFVWLHRLMSVSGLIFPDVGIAISKIGN